MINRNFLDWIEFLILTGLVFLFFLSFQTQSQKGLVQRILPGKDGELVQLCDIAIILLLVRNRKTI